MKPYIFNLSNVGQCLTTRDMAKPLRDTMTELISQQQTIVVDFANVDAVTPSFVDELLGVLVDNLGTRAFRSTVQFTNAREDIKRLVNLVLNARLSKHRTAAQVI